MVTTVANLVQIHDDMSFKVPPLVKYHRMLASGKLRPHSCCQINTSSVFPLNTIIQKERRVIIIIIIIIIIIMIIIIIIKKIPKQNTPQTNKTTTKQTSKRINKEQNKYKCGKQKSKLASQQTNNTNSPLQVTSSV